MITELILAWNLQRLRNEADGDFALFYNTKLQKWYIGYEGDLKTSWLQSSDIMDVITVFKQRAIRNRRIREMK